MYPPSPRAARQGFTREREPVMMRLPLRCLFVAYVFLQVGSTQNNSCVVTVGAKHTAYNITKMPNVSHLERCEYTWANASNHVFAHNLDKHSELVMRKSADTLVILECMNHTILSLDCYPQGRFTFHCFCDCPERAALQEDKGPLTETSNSWIYVIVVIVIILVSVLCFLVYRYNTEMIFPGNATISATTLQGSVDQPIVDV